MAQYTSEALERGLLTTLLEFQANETPLLVDLLCEQIQSKGEDEKHEWLGQAPQMSEHLGGNRYDQMTGTSYTLENVTYQAGVEIKREHFEDNRSGSIRMRIDQLAATARAHANKLVVSTITAGTTGTGYDGSAFFADAHAARGSSGAQDNLLAGTGTTTAQIGADINSARAAMFNFLAENGEPFHGDAFSQMVFLAPPALEKGFRENLEAQLVSSGSTNVQQGLGRLVISPRLTATDANDWYAFVVDPARKPLIFQWRQMVEPEVIAEGSELWKHQRLARFIVSARYAAGYGFWQSAVKMVNS